MDERGIDDAMNVVRRIGERIPALSLPLTDVWLIGSALERAEFPDMHMVERAIPREGKSTADAAKSLDQLLRKACMSAARQHRLSFMGKVAVEKARKAVEHEWGT